MSVWPLGMPLPMAHNTKYRPLTHCLLIINIEIIFRDLQISKNILLISAAQHRVCPHSWPWSLALPTSSPRCLPHLLTWLLACLATCTHTCTCTSWPLSAHTYTFICSLSSKPCTESWSINPPGLIYMYCQYKKNRCKCIIMHLIACWLQCFQDCHAKLQASGLRCVECVACCNLFNMVTWPGWTYLNILLPTFCCWICITQRKNNSFPLLLTKNTNDL